MRILNRTTRSFAWISLLLALACASGRTPPPAARPGPAVPAAPAAPAVTGFALSVQPADTEIAVNGASRGKVSALRDGVLVLAPGRYRISLRCRGYVTWRGEVSLEQGLEPLRVTLPPIPKE